MSGATVEDVDHVRWIRFSNPGKRNALKIEDVELIRSSIADAPDDVRCIVFTGSNGDFSAGADVSSFSAASMGKLEVSTDSPGQRMIQQVRLSSKPTIVAIEGYCVGLAMVISAVSDIRVVSRTAKFSMPEVKIGIPVLGDSGIFAQHIGLSRSKELLMLGRYYSAEQLDQWGYINELTDEGKAEDAARVWAADFCKLPPRTMAAQKRIFEAWHQLPPRDAHRVSILEYAVTVAHPDTAKWIEDYAASRKKK